MINIGTLELADAYKGSTPIEKAYIGSQLVWEKSSPVQEYIDVAYIENTSTAYINTGVKPSNSTNFEVSLYNVGGKNSQAIFGCRDALKTKNTSFWLDCDELNDVRVTKGSNNSWGNYDKTIATMGKEVSFTLTGRNVSISVDGGTATTWTLPSSTFTSTYDLFIFSENNAGAFVKGWAAYVKIKSFKIKTGSTLIRDYVPKYKVSTQKYGLYDRVNDVFYTSANEDDFTGPSIT